MMQDLGWEQLQTKLQQNKTVMIYNSLVEISANQYLTPTGVSTRGHQQRLLPYYCSVPSIQLLCQCLPGLLLPICQPVPYQHNPLTASMPSSVLVSQDCNCGQPVFNLLLDMYIESLPSAMF